MIRFWIRHFVYDAIRDSVCMNTHQFPGSQLFGSNTFGFFDIAADTTFEHWSESQCSILMFGSLIASTMVRVWLLDKL